MRTLFTMERRLQDLERKFENKERMGEIVDTKFDNEKKRWYVKINDGEDLTPSGQQSSAQGSEDTFKSDWLAWQSFSHGTIKMSIPPKKGMKALMRSPGGLPEMAVAEPYHGGPDTPSPHDKEDEIVKLIEDEDQKDGQSSGGSQEDKFNAWTRETKDTHHLIIQKKKQDDQSTDQTASQNSSGGTSKKKQKSRKLPDVPEDGDDKTLQVKATKDGWLLTHGKSKAKIKVNETDITIQQENVSIKITKDEALVSNGDDTKLSVKKDEIQGSVGSANVKVKSVGARLKCGPDYLVVVDGNIFVSKIPVIGPDPLG